jgi:ribosome-associated protein
VREGGPALLARQAFEAMSDRQATDLVILDISALTGVADLFVIGTVGTTRQMRAVIEAVRENLRAVAGSAPASVEGAPESGWVLLDYADVVVHVFDAETRAYYQLEEIWKDAPLVARMR